MIDHHVRQDDLGARLFKNTDAEATGRLVLEAADALGVPLSPQIALPLFAAVATDTGWFRFASTEPGTYRIAARLIEAGVKPDWLYKQLYEQDTLARLRLIGNTLARADRPGRPAHLHMDRVGRFRCGRGDPLRQRGRDQHDVDGRRARRRRSSLVELRSGGFKVSFRSRCELDCSAVAERFGGGGTSGRPARP